MIQNKEINTAYRAIADARCSIMEYVKILAERPNDVETHRFLKLSRDQLGIAIYNYNELYNSLPENKRVLR